MDFASYGLAFLEGIGLILSPCILPILPIVLSLGISGQKGRPYGIIVGFVFSFAALTLLSRQLVTSLGIDIEVIRYISFALLFTFGFVLISDFLSGKLALWTSSFANVGESILQKKNNSSGFLGGIPLGIAIGLTWVPCAGPIMAAVILQTVTQQTTLDTVMTLLSFSLGASVPMLLLVLMGRHLLNYIAVLKYHTESIRKVLGVIIILSVAYSVWPAGFNLKISEALSKSEPSSSSSHSIGKLKNALSNPYKSPEISGISEWINSKPLTLKQLKGKVVLIDFWTYSCINCVRTLPILTKWDKAYRDKGLVIIGIHTPEFEFEKKLSNVQTAVKQHGIEYPVALDNDFKTWIHFDNHYWPAHYLIDKEGNVRYTHFGEGEYDATESNIRYLLGIETIPATKKLDTEKHEADITPETYLGYERGEHHAPSFHPLPDKATDYGIFDKKIPLHHWVLEGKWNVQAQKITAEEAGAKIQLHFKAKKVFLVLGNRDHMPISAKISLKANSERKSSHQFMGKDIKNNAVVVDKDTLYELISLDKTEEGTVEIEATAPGLEAYAFTFG